MTIVLANKSTVSELRVLWGFSGRQTFSEHSKTFKEIFGTDLKATSNDY